MADFGSLGGSALKRVAQQGAIAAVTNRPTGLMWFLTGGRSYAPATFSLTLDGDGNVSLIRSISGGGVRADVTSFQEGPSYYRRRMLGGKLKFEDLKLHVGMGASKPFWEWIKGFFTGKGERQTGALGIGDENFRERVRREFRGAMIHELTFPQLDAQQQNAEAYFTVGLGMENVEFKEGAGILPIQGELQGVAHEKDYLGSNFKLMLDGFETSSVCKVDSFTIKHTMMEYYVGGRREPIKMPSWIEFPNISFYLPESQSYEFDKAAEERIVTGKSKGRFTGALEMLSKENLPLCTLSFDGAEIVNVTADGSDASKDSAKLVKVEICVESMSFQYSLIADLQRWASTASNILGRFVSAPASKLISSTTNPSIGVVRNPADGVNEVFKRI